MSGPTPDDRDPDRDRDRDDRRRKDRDDLIPDWVEKVTGIAGALGFNKVRVRWKLQGYVNRQRAADRRHEQAVAHVKYQHRVCHHCHAVNDRDEKLCTRCGRPLGTRAFEILGRLGIHAPRALSVGSLVGLILVAAYVRIFAAYGGGIGLSFEGLIAHGASLPLDQNDGESWRATTAVLLHASLWHLAFNLFALASIAPVAEDRFGRGVTLLLFMVTGTIGAFASAMLGPPAIGVGASGAIMGLVGAVAGAGHRAGTAIGRAERDAMIKWVLYVFVFGLLINADHYAHGGGLVAGAAFGLLVPTRAITRAGARNIQLIAGGVALAWLAAATVAVMVPLQGTPAWLNDSDRNGQPAEREWPTGDPGDRDDLGTMLWLCSDRVTPEDINAFGGQPAIDDVCASLGELRTLCRARATATADAAPGTTAAAGTAATADDWTARQCADLARLDGKWPPPR